MPDEVMRIASEMDRPSDALSSEPIVRLVELIALVVMFDPLLK